MGEFGSWSRAGLGALGFGLSGYGVSINPADMLNAIPRVYSKSRLQNIDPTQPMSSKAAHLLSLGGSIRGDA